MIKVLIIDQDKSFYKEIKWALSDQYQYELVGIADQIELVNMVLNEKKPTLVIVGPSWNKNHLTKMRKNLIDRDKFNLLLISPNVTSDLIQTAIEIKATDVLSLPLQKRQLMNSLERAQNLFEAKVQTHEKQDQKAEVITVFGPKGGVGKSVIATNLATLLSRREEKRTVIMDADLQFGDVGVMLRMEPEKNIFQAVCDPKLTIEKFKDFLIEHSSGFKALLAPVEPEMSDLVKPVEIEQTIKFLKRLADFIVIDTPPVISDNVLSILDNSDWLLLVIAMDVPSLKNAKLTIETLEMLKYDLKKVRLIINRKSDSLGATTEELEKALGFKIDFFIPEDREVIKSVNEGEPIVLYNPKSIVARKMEEIANMLLKDISISEINISKSRQTA